MRIFHGDSDVLTDLIDMGDGVAVDNRRAERDGVGGEDIHHVQRLL